MHRLLAIFLLLLLPLQFGFAAAAEYCEGSKADRGHHFGHHAHPSASKADTKHDGGSPKSSKPECGFCMLACAHAQVSDVAFAMPEEVRCFPVADPPQPEERIPPGLERPPRSVIA